jgi:hypothetical protein
MLNFFIGFAFFEAGAIFGFFVAALMQAARSGEIGLNGKEVSFTSADMPLQRRGTSLRR